MKVLDLFCGAGGSTVGLSLLGCEVTGLDYDEDSVATHEAAGHPTLRYNLTERPLPFAEGDFDGVWASPPCTAFSNAGKREGVGLAEELIDAMLDERWGHFDGSDINPAVWLALPTLFHVIQMRPRWTAWENVKQTAPVMEAALTVLRRYGYEGEVVVLKSEQYGVAQTRQRAFLIAARDHTPVTPEPTHAEYVHPRFHKKREQVAEEAARNGTPPWVSMAEALGWVMPEWVTLNTGRDWKKGGTRDDAQQIDPDQPCPAITHQADAWKWWMKKRNDQSGTDVDVTWPTQRPATAIAGRGLVPDPGANANRFNGSTKSRNDGFNITPAEAARLQAFPTEHPFQGGRTSVFTQIGNAVPPPLAAAVAGAAAGVAWQPAVAAYLSVLYRRPVPQEVAA